ncbi:MULTISPECIES: trigger factor [Ligilactobacillus]|uniref:Trigger factor n=2 Tax=Ligilactobacillus TaxID=2767887 RepID=A0A0R1ZC07_9LACO|nr:MULTISPECIES: trigger factor [Ligilactobacillus]KRM51850.1 trigger factor, PPIase [Ligilactobacillus araffinosus DSM 20653]OAP98657.1 trigger factor [Ligilactobacillus aviarius]OAP98777.1 trigger factor [Ligilactobacillus aviarius]OAP99841.1 trigger factor [Ligilactobacillus aviarius]OAQ02114.1 trigger factor [Ligilactobacillus aviarius]
MSVKWEKKEGTNDGKLTFEIQPDKIKEGLDIAFNKVKKSLNVPGFRKGRVPRQIFNKMYGEEALYQDALNALLPEAYANAVSESKIKPVSQPEINVESMEKDSAWVLSAKVTVEPEVELGEYKGLEVMKHSTDVSDKEVADELERRRQQQAELVLKEDEPAAEGDTVVIDFEGKVDGKPFDGGKAENYSLELGSKTFIPGFEDQLVGHKAGDEVEVKVTFPDDYQAKDLQGKDAVFEVKIHEVKQKELPELDDDFAKDIDDDVDTLEELKAKVKDEIKEQKEAAAKNAVQEEAISKAVENAKIGDIPEAMIEDDVQRQMDQYFSGMQQQGINPDMYFKLTGTSEEDLRKQFREGSEERVKTNLVLEAIVEKENIEISEDEINDEIKDLATQYGMDEKAVRSALSDDMLKHDISIRKVVQEMTDSAKQDLPEKKEEK